MSEEVKNDDVVEETVIEENVDEANQESAAGEDAKNDARGTTEEVNDCTEGEATSAGDEGCEESGEEASDESEDTEDDEASEDSKSTKKKGLFKKNKKDPKDEKIEELNDRVKRQMAEFENFRKRTEKEKSSMYEMGAKAVIEKILPVIDNFERGLDNIPEGADDGFVEGMKMIYRQLLTELDNLGVKPIEALGKEFDPNFHNAVMQIESEEYESGIVAQELQKGYMYRDSVVRHSMVAVVP